jgi:signal transduction histidine kinase
MINTLPRIGDVEANIVGVICVVWNISALSETQVQDLIQHDSFYRQEIASIASDMKQLNEQLEMKRNFVRGVSHEIRTPLNIVLAGLQLIENQFASQVSVEVMNLIKEIKQSCRDGVDILDDLLAYEKLEGKLVEAEKEPVSANALVQECLQPFQMQARLNNVSLEYAESLVVGSEETPCRDLMVFVDHFKVRQVARNLISNAIKFTPSGGVVKCKVSWVKKTTASRAVESDKGFVRIEVSDSGVGLTEVRRNIVRII